MSLQFNILEDDIGHSWAFPYNAILTYGRTIARIKTNQKTYYVLRSAENQKWYAVSRHFKDDGDASEPFDHPEAVVATFRFLGCTIT